MFQNQEERKMIKKMKLKKRKEKNKIKKLWKKINNN